LDRWAVEAAEADDAEAAAPVGVDMAAARAAAAIGESAVPVVTKGARVSCSVVQWLDLSLVCEVVAAGGWRVQ
jgi:hypothetical protein